MAHFVLKDATLVINSVDLSDHLKQITVAFGAGEVDDSNMGDDWEGKLQGIKNFNISAEFDQDFAASEVDATIWGAYNTGTPVTFAGKPTSGAISTSNPEYQGSVIITQYNPIDGTHGDKARTTVTFPGTGAVTRDVTP